MAAHEYLESLIGAEALKTSSSWRESYAWVELETFYFPVDCTVQRKGKGTKFKNYHTIGFINLFSVILLSSVNDHCIKERIKCCRIHTYRYICIYTYLYILPHFFVQLYQNSSPKHQQTHCSITWINSLKTSGSGECHHWTTKYDSEHHLTSFFFYK